MNMLELITIVDPYAVMINFLCHVTIFLGGLYVAIHSRSIPNWLRTCLWYIGCSSFLIGTFIVCGWSLGNDFVFSYSNAGVIGETLFNVWISVTTLAFFFKTLVEDVKHSRRRSDI